MPIGKPVIVEGVKLVPYHELTARYITESMHLLKTKEGWKIGPDYHRGKDVAKSLATLYELRAAYAKSINPIKASRIKTLESAIEGMGVMTEEGYFPVKKVWHGKKQVTYDIYADVMAGLEKRRFMFSAGYEPVYPEEIPVGAVSDWSGVPIPQDVPISKVFHHVEYPNKGVWLTPEEHTTLHGMTEGKIPVMEIPQRKIIWEPDIDTPVNLPSFLQEPGRQVGKPGSIERIPVVDISLGEVIPTKAFFKKYVPLTQSRYTRLPLTRRYVDLSVWESRIFDPLYSKIPAPYREWGIPSGYPWGIIEERIIKQKIVSEPKIKGSLPSSAISSVLDTIDSAAPKGRVKTTGQKYPITRAKTIKTPTPVLVSGESAVRYPVGKSTKIPRVLGQLYKAPRKRPEEERTPEYFTTIIYPPGKTPVKTPTTIPKTTPGYTPGKPPKTPPLKPPTDIPPTYPTGRPPKVPPNIPPTSPPGYPPGRPPGRPPTYPPPRTPPPKVPPPETPPPETPPRYPPPVFPPPPTPPKYPPVKPPKAPPVIIQLTVTTPHRRKEKKEYPGKLNRVWPEFFPYAQHAPVISPTSMLKGVLSGKKLKPVRS